MRPHPSNAETNALKQALDDLALAKNTIALQKEALAAHEALHATRKETIEDQRQLITSLKERLAVHESVQSQKFLAETNEMTAAMKRWGEAMEQDAVASRAELNNKFQSLNDKMDALKNKIQGRESAASDRKPSGEAVEREKPGE